MLEGDDQHDWPSDFSLGVRLANEKNSRLSQLPAARRCVTSEMFALYLEASSLRRRR